jgi:hypothetical protein
VAAAKSAPSAIKSRSLHPVDKAFGSTFTIAVFGRTLRFYDSDLGVVREIFGRESYCTPSELANARRIVDLGANSGIFSIFAAVSSSARIIAVEAQSSLVAVLERNISQNGVSEQVRIENALAGGAINEWANHLLVENPSLKLWDFEKSVPAGESVDFLKCDIEGAEYVLFDPMPQWIHRVKRFALEYHGDYDSGQLLAERFRVAGFEVTQRSHRHLGYLFGIRLNHE